MKAISIHAPWAWAIIAGHKRFENRSWSTTHRGELAIHASHSKSSDAAAIELMAKIGITPPTIDELDESRGKVIGLVELVEVIEFETADESVKLDPFASGPLCFLLDHPQQLEPEVAKGNLRIWNWDR